LTILSSLGTTILNMKLLRAKEASRSVLERFAGRSQFSHRGRRVVEGSG